MPEAVEKVLKEKEPDRSVASWAIRFVGSLDGLICCLSGMSTTEQVLDNVRSYRELEPLSTEECRWLTEDINVLYRAQGAVKDLSRYKGLKLYGVPVTAIMEGYSVCQFQPDPRGSDDNNYLLNAIAEEIHRDFKEDLPRERLVNNGGVDVTDEVYQAYDWLREHTF